MPSFAYQTVDASGKRSKGLAESASAGSLSRSLEERGLLVLDVSPTEERIVAGGKGLKFGRRREVLEVTRALAALLPAGMPLAHALSAAQNVSSGDVREALQAVRTRVERGDHLADALQEQGQYFSPLYVGIVRAGEKSGDLDTAFTRLSETLERDEALRGRLISAAVYPILLAVVGTIAVTVLLLFVLPRFVTLLQGNGTGLPKTTAFLLNVSLTLRQYWPFLLTIPVGGFALGSWFRKTAEGKRAFSRLMLAMPLTNTLRRYALAARFARLNGVLLGGGAPLLTALEDSIESLSDPIARDDVARIRNRVREGSSLRKAIQEGTLFPPLLSQLVAVGEDAGQLQTFLLKAADIFEDKTERATQRLATIMEPAMIVFFGAIVAFVALSLLQAIYGVNATSFK
jgi:general secretion pathway protein F